VKVKLSKIELVGLFILAYVYSITWSL